MFTCIQGSCVIRADRGLGGLIRVFLRKDLEGSHKKSVALGAYSCRRTYNRSLKSKCPTGVAPASRVVEGRFSSLSGAIEVDTTDKPGG